MGAPLRQDDFIPLGGQAPEEVPGLHVTNAYATGSALVRLWGIMGFAKGKACGACASPLYEVPWGRESYWVDQWLRRHAKAPCPGDRFGAQTSHNLGELERRVRRVLEGLGGRRGRGHCRSCHRPVYWLTTPRDKHLPYNPDGTSHWGTCPNADQHRRKKS